MIDLKALAMQENTHRIMEAAGFTPQGGAELRRLAMRYLALRDSGNYSAGMSGDKWGFRMTGAPLLDTEIAELDAAADRLIQEMVK